MHKFSLLLILCLSIANAKGQTPSLNFQFFETNNNVYDISTVLPLPDNTYGVFGNNSFDKYMVFIKMDSLGNVIFNKKYTFSDGLGTQFGSAIVNKNGEIAIVGNDLAVFNSNMMFLRLNLNGDIISSKFYSAYSYETNERGYSLIQTPDLGYILGGGTGNDDMFLTRIDSAGTRTWSRRYGFSSGTRAESMEIIGNNIYIASSGGFNFAYHKVDLNGNFIWTKNTPASFGTFSQKIIKTADNKLLVGGSNNFMGKIDTNGAFIWKRFYDGTSVRYGLGTITATPDGGFISCGEIKGSYVNILSEGCITKFNALGELQWVRRMGTIRNDETRMIVNAHGNRGFFVLGRCDDLNPASASNFFLARLGNDGYMANITCEYSSEIEVSSSSNYSYTTYSSTQTPQALGITTVPQGTLSVSNNVRLVKLSSCDNDVELTEIVSPNAVYCATSSIPVRVRITNKGKTPVYRLTDNFFAGYVNYGSNIVLPNFTNLNILPQRDTVLTIATINSPRVGNLNLTVVLPYTVNEFSDINTSNNTLRKTINYNPLTATIVATQTTLCPNDSTNLTASPSINAISYQWFRNNDTLRGAINNVLTVKDNATYFVTIKNVDNCPYNSNSIQLTSTTRPTTPVITRSGNILTATNTTATSFQWYFNGNLITNANQLTYTATQNGNYTVVAIGLSCNSSTSTIYNFIISNTNDVNELNVTIQPNPLNHTLQITSVTELKTIAIYDLIGQLHYQKAITDNAKTITITDLDLNNGSYLLKAIDNQNNSFVKKIMVLH
jgi:hypothetical protein